jgi:hypothetical protein
VLGNHDYWTHAPPSAARSRIRRVVAEQPQCGLDAAARSFTSRAWTIWEQHHDLDAACATCLGAAAALPPTNPITTTYGNGRVGPSFPAQSRRAGAAAGTRAEAAWLRGSTTWALRPDGMLYANRAGMVAPHAFNCREITPHPARLTRPIAV